MSLRILFSMLTIVAASAAVGYGTYAAFSDTKTSASNVFTAGTLTLDVTSPTTVNGFIGSSGFAPGDSVSGSLTLINTGNILDGVGGRHVRLVMGASSTNAAFSPHLKLTTLTYDGSDVLADIADSNGNLFKDLADLQADPVTLPDPAGEPGKELAVTVEFDFGAPSDLRGATNTLTLSFTLEQYQP